MSATAQNLNHLLADYQVLYQKLRSYHWNVKGPMFFELHAKFEELYLTTAERVDEIAERILAIREKPISTMKAALDHARLQEDAGDIAAQQMVASLVDDYETLGEHLRSTAKQAEEAGDAATFNMLEGFADEQEKTSWMLRSYLA